MSDSGRLKVLLLTPQLPYPPEQGTSLRNFHIVRGLAQDQDVWLLSFLEPGQPEGGSGTPLIDLCRQVVTVEAPRRTMTQRFWRLLTDRRPDMAHRLESEAFEMALISMLQRESFDVVQIEGIELASHITQIRRYRPEAMIVFDDHNAEAELQRRIFATDIRAPQRWIGAAYSFVQWRRLCRFERTAALTADGVTVVSAADASQLRALSPQIEPVVIPNCIDVQTYDVLPSPVERRIDVLFIGKMDYRPNVDAVIWFGEHIWPLVRARCTKAAWAVVGKSPHPRLEVLAHTAGVTVIGAVDDIRPYLAAAKVYVMPFRMGSGTRLKLIEALASGIATVSTRMGAEGYPLQDGAQVLFADAPAGFAQSVIELLEDDERREALQQAGRAFAQQYDWRRVIPLFSALYKRLLAL